MSCEIVKSGVRVLGTYRGLPGSEITYGQKYRAILKQKDDTTVLTTSTNVSGACTYRQRHDERNII